MPRAWGPHRCDAHDPDPKWAGRFCRDARAPTCYTSSVLLGPGEVHEAAGIHRTYRQRCSRVATCSARAAGGEPTIGYLGATTPSAESQRVAALVQRLRAFGWIESRNLTIEYRYAEGRSERYAQLAAEFVRLNVDVIITSGTPAVAATRQATAVIPIVFAAAGDPIGSGLVASLPRPGGNVTGLSLQKTDVADKRLELLREVVPGLRGLEMREVEATARRFGHEVATFEIRGGYCSHLRGPQGWGGCTLRLRRSACRHQPDSHHYLGAWCATSVNVRFSGIR